MSDSIAFGFVLIAAAAIAVFGCEAVDAWHRRKDRKDD